MNLWDTLLRRLPGVVHVHEITLTGESEKRAAERKIEEIEQRLRWLTDQRDVSR